jgi:hypothetical protein
MKTNFMKIHPVGAKPVCADGLTNITKIIGAVCENVNAPDKDSNHISQGTVFAVVA